MRVTLNQLGLVEVLRREILKDLNASVDKDGNTLLHLAARHGYTEVVEKLIKAGADVNIANRNGDTPLGLARRNGHREITEMLLNKKLGLSDVVE